MINKRKINRLVSALLYKGITSGLVLIGFMSPAQVVIEPGDKNVNGSGLKTGKFTWAWFEDERRDMGKEFLTIQRANQKITFVKRRVSNNMDANDVDSLVLDANTLAPIYRDYKGGEVTFSIQYSSNLKGSRTVYETRGKEVLNEAFDGKSFDKESLPLVISCLPLSKGYQAFIPIVDYTSEFKPVYYTYRITQVIDQLVDSDVSGQHDAWKVTAFERKRGYEYVLYIDKVSRRILKMDFTVSSVLLNHNFFDKETDVNPIKAAFNQEETWAMIMKGTSSIKGQAYTRAFGKKSFGYRNGKQYAQQGSVVLLIPNTPYFKEWVNYNATLSKKNPAYTVDWGGAFGGAGGSNKTTIGSFYPLPPEVSKCMVTTTVIDDKGNFVFENLKPGEYLVFVSFMANKYSHSTKTPTGSYNIYINGDGSGTAVPIDNVTAWLTPQNIQSYKYITVKKEGEAITVLFND